MKRISFGALSRVLVLCGGLTFCGCGGSGGTAPATTQADTAAPGAAQDSSAPSEAGSDIRTAELSTPPAPPPVTDPAATANGAAAPQKILQTSAERKAADDDDDEAFAVGDDEVDTVKPGSPEALLREMARLRSAQLDVVRQPIAGQPGKFEEKKLTPEQSAEELKRRCHIIVQKAMQILIATRTDPAQEKLFNNAVHFLCDARTKLALAGEPDQVELLNQDAEALYKRNKDSFAAAEAGHRLVQLTEALAEESGKRDPKLAVAMARQARMFAERFPKEVNRAPMGLLTAGRYCELYGAPAEAKMCYEAIETQFAKTPFADQVAGSLRRIRLPGQTLAEFGGPTLDGGFVKLEDYAGKPLLLVFWSKDSETFNKDLPRLLAAEAKYGPAGLHVIGVNLDRDELELERYLEKSGISWRQIFHTDLASRGTRNPVAAHYGVTSVPTYWLIDGQRRVLAAPLPIEQLEAGIQYALKPR